MHPAPMSRRRSSRPKAGPTSPRRGRSAPAPTQTPDSRRGGGRDTPAPPAGRSLRDPGARSRSVRGEGRARPRVGKAARRADSDRVRPRTGPWPRVAQALPGAAPPGSDPVPAHSGHPRLQAGSGVQGGQDETFPPSTFTARMAGRCAWPSLPLPARGKRRQGSMRKRPPAVFPAPVGVYCGGSDPPASSRARVKSGALSPLLFRVK